MDKAMQESILGIIDNGKDLTLATIRPDGYPQATTVSYANDGMTIYVAIGKDSQKANNIRHCNKVSLTINAEYQDWNHIKGISMGALAEMISDPDEIKHATSCMIKRFPQVAELADAPQAADIALLRITPQVISVLDYKKGFGHTDLVTV
jgi:nitroimidazol reductase NimA-like FMN-containing flavoprotein (pyridoxamine 5'-phosphate oxidase superfamily)